MTKAFVQAVACFAVGLTVGYGSAYAGDHRRDDAARDHAAIERLDASIARDRADIVVDRTKDDHNVAGDLRDLARDVEARERLREDLRDDTADH